MNDDWDDRTAFEEHVSSQLIGLLVCAASGSLVGFVAGVVVGLVVGRLLR